MRRLGLILPAVIAVALAATPSALAKEIGSVKACGASGCTDVTDRGSHDESTFAVGSRRGGPPDRRAPFYRVEITMRHEGEDVPGWTFEFVPSLAVIRADDEYGRPAWYAVPRDQLAGLRRLVAGVRPFPARRLSIAAPKPPEARVVETFAPAERASAPASSSDGGGLAWWTIGAGAVVLAAGTGVLLVRRGRRRLPDSTTWPTSA